MDRSAKALQFRLGRLPEDYRDGVRQAAAIADQDPGMGLARCRATLEKFVGGLFAAHVAAPTHKDTLDGMLARLHKDGHFPEPLVTYADTVRFAPADVRRALDLLLAILDWHFGGILPDAGAFGDLPTPDGEAYARNLVRQQGPGAEAFTPLFLRPDDRAAPPIGVAPARLLAGQRGPLDMPDGAEAPPGPDTRPLTAVADEHPFLVLRGEPGAGKTTACAYLAFRAAEAYLTGGPPRPLPVLVELRRFAPRDRESPADALARLVAAALKDGGSLPAAYVPDDADARLWLAEACDARPLALYLDGLNEVGPAGRDAVIDALAGLLNQLRGTPSRVVVSTRRHGFEALRLGTLKVYDLQPLAPAAIQDYLGRRLRLGADEAARLYHDQLGARLRLQSSNPLLLNLLCEVLQRGEPPPASRGELFRVFIDGVLGRWEPGKGADFGQRGFPVAAKLRALEAVAYHMHERGRLLPAEEAGRLFREVLGPAAAPDELLQELCTNHLLLARRGDVEFAHHTLQEHFCAAALHRLWRHGDAPAGSRPGLTLGEARCDPRWWETLAMVGSLLAGGELERFLLEVGDEPVLAGMALGHAPAGTFAEESFVRRAEGRLRGGVAAAVACSQAALVAVPLGMAAAAGLALAGMYAGLDLALATLPIDPLDGLPVWTFWAWVVLWSGVLSTLLLGGPAARSVAWFHDRALDRAYARWLEPWLLGLHYANTPRAAEVLAALPGRYAGRRFVDLHLQRSLRAFAVRADATDPDRLRADLEDPNRRGVAVSVLAADFRPEVARDLVRGLPARSPQRRQGEVELCLAWLRRHPAARTTLLPALELLLREDGCDLRLRRGLARALRRHGFSRARVPVTAAELLGRALAPAVWCSQALMSLLTPHVRVFCALPLRRWGARAAVRWGRLRAFAPGPAGLNDLAKWMAREGYADEAEALLRHGLARHPDHPLLLLRWGDLLQFARGRYGEAAAAYRTALARWPDFDLLWALLANALRRAGQADDAREAAERAREFAGSKGRYEWLLSSIARRAARAARVPAKTAAPGES